MAAEDVSFKSKVFSGFFWLSSGMFIGQGISWISTLVVIRLLLPTDYGLLAMATSVTVFVTTISELGICASIIQAKEINEKEIGQIFGFGVLTSAAACALCYSAAPHIAAFYNQPQLIPVIRLLSINFIIMIFFMIPEAIYIRAMNFKVKAIIDISAQVGASLFTLILALNSAGVWALVGGLLMNHSVKAVAYNIFCSSWVKPLFRFKGAGNFMRYGLKVTGSRLLYYLFTTSDAVIIGKFLGNHLLGLYAVALNLASIPAEKVLPIINQVTFTSYSRIQSDKDRIARNVLRGTRTLALVSFPLFFGMAGVAEEALPVLLGEKWKAITVPFQLLCLVLPLKALGPVFNTAIFAVGRAGVNVINSTIILIVMASAFLAGVRNGIAGVCLAWGIAYPAAFMIACFRSLRVLGIPLGHYLHEIVFPASASAVMLFTLILIKKTLTAFPSLFSLFILILAGMAVYLCLALVFRKDQYTELTKLLHRS